MPIRKIIQQALLEPHFQPIVAVNEGRIVGYEALIRGPRDSGLREPLALFSAASEAGLTRELERACLTTIARGVAKHIDRLPRWARFFLNVFPEDILDPVFLTHIVGELGKIRLDPARVVIEITEGTRIDNYQAFNTCLSRYRNLGFGIAVDDAGAGHAGLQLIAEINPDYLKIDQSLVRGIDRSIAKRAGVEALILLARSLGMSVIAEGIEQEEELRELHQLGIALGQGFLLARPSPEMEPGVTSAPVELRRAAWGSLDTESFSLGDRIGDIATPVPTLTLSSTLGQLSRTFEMRRDCDAVVLVDKGAPVGLVMRQYLQRELGRPFSDERLGSLRAVQLTGEHAPLIVDCGMSLEAVAQQAMARATESMYDHVVLVRDGKLAGAASIQKLLQAIAKRRIDAARHAHPLTGLAGHAALEEWLREHMRRREEFTLVHIDIDALRTFNEICGFRAGDRAIRIAADLISAELGLRTSGELLLAHSGSDDFHVITSPQVADYLMNNLPRLFSQRTNMLYSPEDRSRGYLIQRGANGALQHAPLLSMTLARVTPLPGRHDHCSEVLDQLADAMRAAKARTAAVREADPRRTPASLRVLESDGDAPGKRNTAA